MSEVQCDNSRSNAASLGCGTLILIALIVLFFGNTDLTPLQNEVASLRKEVEVLQRQQRETHALLETIVLHIDPKPRDEGTAPPIETTKP
ncbi:MAG: hypothetical protein K8E66_10375 [Phycisphaerales bacterium]|nr:hypothetical protein [Phycisphaerales bacterium]